MKLNASCGISGDYKLRILDGKTRALKYESPDWIPNLITDLGMDRIAAGSIGQHCRIGTGTSTPANSDTALQSQSASTLSVVSNSSSNAGAPNYESTFVSTYEFALGAVVGNMGEIGLGWTASTASTLATRSRILDAGGFPTTITVTASEILQVTYRIKSWPKLTDDTGVVNISGTNYNYTARASSIANVGGLSPALAGGPSSISGGGCTVYNGAIGANTGIPSGSTATLLAPSLAGYTNGTYYREVVCTADLVNGNVSGGITALKIVWNKSNSTKWADHQIGFSPAIPKDSTKTFSLTLRTSWARR